jgi:hypothetical protein
MNRISDFCDAIDVPTTHQDLCPRISDLTEVRSVRIIPDNLVGRVLHPYHVVLGMETLLLHSTRSLSAGDYKEI